MKLELKDLIPDRYYKCLHIDKHINYFKFKNITNDHIIFYDHIIIIDKRNNIEYLESSNTVKLSIEYYNFYVKIFEEIDPIILINYFPSDYPDMKYLIRKKKINYLLNI